MNIMVFHSKHTVWVLLVGQHLDNMNDHKLVTNEQGNNEKWGQEQPVVLRPNNIPVQHNQDQSQIRCK